MASSPGGFDDRYSELKVIATLMMGLNMRCSFGRFFGGGGGGRGGKGRCR